MAASRDSKSGKQKPQSQAKRADEPSKDKPPGKKKDTTKRPNAKATGSSSTGRTFTYRQPPPPKPKDKVAHISLTDEQERELGLVEDTEMDGVTITKRKTLKRASHMADSDIASNLEKQTTLITDLAAKVNSLSDSMRSQFREVYAFDLSKESADKKRFKCLARQLRGMEERVTKQCIDGVMTALTTQLEITRPTVNVNIGGPSPAGPTATTSFSNTPLKTFMGVPEAMAKNLTFDHVLAAAPKHVKQGKFQPEIVRVENLTDPDELEEELARACKWTLPPVNVTINDEGTLLSPAKNAANLGESETKVGGKLR